MKNEFKYLANGQQVRIVREIKEGYLIQEIYRLESPDPQDGDFEWVDESRMRFVEASEVFDSAPTLKYAVKVKELEIKIANLQLKRRDVANQIRDAEAAGEEKLKKYRQFEQLKHLDRFLNEGITHYVVLSLRNPQILDFGKAKCESYREDLKLLTLFGSSKGNLEWRLSCYSDGSGYSETVIPCISYEEAKQELQKHIDSNEIQEKQKPNKAIIGAAKEHGLRISKTYIKRQKDEERANLELRVVEGC